MESGRIVFLGCPLDMIAPGEMLARAAKALGGRGRLRIEGLNVAKLVEARGDPALMAALREAEMVHVDGAGISLGLKALGMAAPERRAGIDLMGDLCQLAAAMDSGVYLLGARPGQHARFENRRDTGRLFRRGARGGRRAGYSAIRRGNSVYRYQLAQERTLPAGALATVGRGRGHGGGRFVRCGFRRLAAGAELDAAPWA